ncbi:MAG: carbohydrate ABC transporter permease [Acetanaerobacterium sp.]
MLSKVSKKDKREWLTASLLVLPCTIVILVMTVYPLIQVVTMSFSSVKLPSFEYDFIGLDNFTRILAKPQFSSIIWNTVIWTVASLILRFVIGFVAALLMESA